jgi:hypothetical protein
MALVRTGQSYVWANFQVGFNLILVRRPPGAPKRTVYKFSFIIGAREMIAFVNRVRLFIIIIVIVIAIGLERLQALPKDFEKFTYPAGWDCHVPVDQRLLI